MTFEQNMILTGLEYIIMIFIIFRLAWEDIRDHYKPVIIFAPITLAIETLKFAVNDIAITIAYFICVALFIKLTFKNTFLVSVFITLITVSSHFIINNLIMGSLSLLGMDTSFQFQIGILVVSISITISFLIYLYVPLNKIVTLAKNYKNLGYMLSLSSAIIILISYYINWQFRAGDMVNFQVLAFPVLILLIGYTIFNYIYSLNSIRLSKKYLANFEEKGLNDPNLYNDFDTSFKIVKALSILGDDTKTDTYIEKYFNQMNITQEPIFATAQTNLLDINRKAVAAYLYIKMKQLKSQDINCWLNILDPAIVGKISDRNLIEVLEILINTALDATLENKRGQTFEDIHVRDIIVTFAEDDGISFLLLWSKWDEFMTFEHFEKGHKRLNSEKTYELYKIRKILTQYNYLLHLEERDFYDEEYRCFRLEL